MQVSVENTGTLGRKLTISVPAERFEKEFVNRLTKLSKQVKMSGFRPGKVPLKVVEKQYGQQITDEVTGDLIQATYIEALGQEGLRPAGGPKIEPKAISRGEDLQYTAEFEIYPEMDNLEIKGKKIERPVSEIQDEDIDRTVESLQKQRAEWQAVDRKADDGDQVVIDFTGKLDGEPFPGGSATDYSLELGSGAFIAGFEEGLKGLASGAETTLKLKFPESYHSEQLAGKDVEFDVTVKEVREAKLPEVNEEFVKSLGISSGTVEEFRNEVRANLERERDDRQRSLVRSRVLDALYEVNSKVEIPQALLLEEVKRIRGERNAYGQGSVDTGEPTEDETKLAHRRVTLALAFAEVIRSNGLKIEPEFLKKRVEALAEGYEQPQEFIRMIYADNNRRSQIESMLLEELAIDKLLESADVQDKSTSFKDLVSMIRPGA